MSELAPDLERRIERLEGDLRVAVAADFDAGSWAWMIALGVVLPATLLVLGWWYAPGEY